MATALSASQFIEQAITQHVLARFHVRQVAGKWIVTDRAGIEVAGGFASPADATAWASGEVLLDGVALHERCKQAGCSGVVRVVVIRRFDIHGAAHLIQDRVSRCSQGHVQEVR